MNTITVSNLTKKFRFPVKNESLGFLKNLLNPDMKEVVDAKTAWNEVKN